MTATQSPLLSPVVLDPWVNLLFAVCVGGALSACDEAAPRADSGSGATGADAGADAAFDQEVVDGSAEQVADSTVSSEGGAAPVLDGSVPDAQLGDTESDAGNGSDAGDENDLADAGDAGGNLVSSPPRLLPLGDSITQGTGGSVPTYSYRYPLFQRLVDEGFEVDFIGSQTGGFEGSPDWADYMGVPFDRDHEGHWGWRLDMLRDALPGWLAEYTPDLVILMGSTNDVGAGEETATIVEDVRDIIALLRADNPSVVIFWQQPFQPWDPYPDIRGQVELALGELDMPSSPVVVVDAPGVWLSDPEQPASDTVDWVHPSLQGDDKIAAGLVEALRPWLE